MTSSAAAFILGQVVTHEVLPVAPGASIRRSVAECVSQTLAVVNNPREAELCRGWIGQVLIRAGKPRSARQQMQILVDAVRDQTMYLADPVHMEWIQRATRTLCLKPGECSPAGDCFPEGTLLLRDDYELVPIEKIKVGDRIWGRDKWTTVEATRLKGQLPVDAVEMNNGSTMYLTGDHKVFVGRCKHAKSICPTCYPALRRESFERMKVSDLQEGEVLLQPERIDFGVGETDRDRAYVEGLALADGWVRDNLKCFYVAGKDGHRKEAQKHEVKAICERLGIETLWHRRYITVKDPAWAERIARLGARARFKHLETINLSESTAEAYLRGLMADSTPSTSRAPDGGRTYSTTSPRMMLQVRLLHRMFGRSMSYKMLTPEQHGGAGKHPLWRLSVRQPAPDRNEKTLGVKSIERRVKKVACWDVQTSDHYVYLPEHDVTVSNCDDLTVALGSVFIIAGIPAQYVEQHWEGAKQDHILVAGQDETGTWLKVDPSTAWRVGRSATADREVWVDPLKDVAPQLVGLGKLPGVNPGRILERKDGRLWESLDGGASWLEARVQEGPPYLGVALASTPYDQSSADLQNQVVLASQAGDTYVASNEFNNAIQAYQAAGNAGATSVGPEIDLAGAPAVTQPLTQQAWTLNAALAAVDATSTNTATAASNAALAQGYIRQMIALYQQAIAAGQASLGGGIVPASPSGNAASIMKALGIAAGAGALVGLGYAMFRSSHASRRGRSSRRYR